MILFLSVCLHFTISLSDLLSYLVCYVSKSTLEFISVFKWKALFNILHNVDRVLHKCAVINKWSILSFVASGIKALSLQISYIVHWSEIIYVRPSVRPSINILAMTAFKKLHLL